MKTIKLTIKLTHKRHKTLEFLASAKPPEKVLMEIINRGLDNVAVVVKGYER